MVTLQSYICQTHKEKHRHTHTHTEKINLISHQEIPSKIITRLFTNQEDLN